MLLLDVEVDAQKRRRQRNRTGTLGSVLQRGTGAELDAEESTFFTIYTDHLSKVDYITGNLW